MQGSFLEPPKASTRRPSEACYLRCLQLDNTINVIRGSSYFARSSLRFKRYNASISIWVVINSGGYLYMAIPTIKRRDLDGYKEIITYKSCSYVDPKYLHPQ